MELGPFVRGIAIGFSIAAPVGPIGVLVIRRTLTEGRMVGLLTGLGAATADACYGGIGAFGLGYVSSLLLSGQVWLRVIGGAFLCYLGLRTFFAPPATRAAPITGATLLQSYTSTLLLTLTNPATILSFAAIFAGLGFNTSAGARGGAAAVVSGVLVGSALWWLLLCVGVSSLRARITPASLRWISRAAGTLIFGFGMYALFGLFLH